MLREIPESERTLWIKPLCTALELRQWIERNADDPRFSAACSTISDDADSDIRMLLDAANSREAFDGGMQWTKPRVAALLLLTGGLKKEWKWSGKKEWSLIKIVMFVLSGYPEMLQAWIELDLKKQALRLNPPDNVEIIDKPKFEAKS